MDKISFLKWLQGSLDSSINTASGKKLAAFWVIMGLVTPIIYTWLIISFRENKFTLLEEILNSLLLFAAACLSLGVAEKFKKSQTTETTIDPTKTTKNENTDISPQS